MSTIIKHKEFPKFKSWTMDLCGRPMTIEVGKVAELANAAVRVGYGDTRVLCCVTASARPRDGIDFFPLSVDFEEKLYAVGRIPGSFNRREGRPGEKGVLTSRVIDRPIRPLFPHDFRNDVSVMCTVMSVDHDNLPEIAAMIGTSIALSISDIPWGGPIGGVNMGYVNGAYVVCPNSEQRQKSQLNVTVAELLHGCRVEEEQRFTREETEELIRKALIFSAEPPERRQARTQKFLPLYGVSVVLGLVETAAVWAVGLAGTEGAMMLLIINVIFGIVYGAYTLFWMPETLPRYYDENHVCNFAQGAFHMHIPGVYYNNRNWLHVLKAMRVWCVVSMLLTPLCTAAAVVFEQATGWQVWRAVLIGYIASLFGAIVIPAKKYQ